MSYGSRRKKFCACLFLMVLPIISCKADPEFETGSVTIGGHRFEVEIAATQEQRSVGLMHRESLPENRGMIFVYQTEAVADIIVSNGREIEHRRGFYMRNTLIPLSIAYIDRDGVIKEIYDMEPLDERVRRANWPMQFALEVNQGAFERLGIAVGDRAVMSEEITALSR